MRCAFTVGRRSTSRPGTKRISLEELRTLLGLDPIKDVNDNVVREASLPSWASFRQRALDTAIREINGNTDLNIQLESLERSAHRWVTAVTFAIKGSSGAKG